MTLFGVNLELILRLKCTQLFSLQNWTSLQAAALAAIFRVTIGVISSNSK